MLIEKHNFLIIFYYLGCHWKVVKISYNIFITLSSASTYHQSFLPITKCLCYCIIIENFIPFLFPSIFVQKNWFCEQYHTCPLWALIRTVREARKLTGENLKVVLGRVFNFKLGCFVMYTIAWHIQARLILELKTRPSFCPVSLSLSMNCAK